MSTTDQAFDVGVLPGDLVFDGARVFVEVDGERVADLTGAFDLINWSQRFEPVYSSAFGWSSNSVVRGEPLPTRRIEISAEVNPERVRMVRRG